MARQLIATKLYVPRLRSDLVARARLHERLRRAAEARLTLVSAPAGFGKTTLVAAWLQEPAAADRRVAWLSLDPSDNEASSFWTYVVTALQRALGTTAPTIGTDALELVESPPAPTEQALTTLVNELAAVPGEIWLVLDDVHLVDSRDVRDGMAFLLDHLPSHVHVVLITRADPDLPLARWRARGDLVEIRAADLRFTSEEAAEYLEGATGLHLLAADVTVLEQRTEGWIAALQLAALSIQGREDVSGFIAQFAGNDRYVVDYLVEEVLQHLPESVRSFLLQSSVLDRLTGPLCDAVTGRSDSSDVLAELERTNLFIVPLDDQRTWYRYHHLFADVLRARLLSGQPDQVSVLHRRASQWYELDDQLQDAVRHALAGSDLDRAVRLMELAVPSIRRHRQEAMMLGWLAALPDEAVRCSPVLSVFSGHLLLAAGDVTAVERRLDDAERVLDAASSGSASAGADTEELRTLPATIAVYRASLAQAQGDAAGTALHARRALELAGPGDHLARGGAAGFLGLAAWADGDVSEALRTFTLAVASLHAAGNLVDELSSTVVLADLWLLAGRPSTARRLYQDALKLADTHGAPVARATAELLVGLSELDREAADLAAARRGLEAAAALTQGAPMNESRYRWFVAMSRVAEAEGDPGEAIGLLDQAEQLYRRGFFPDVRPVAAMRSRVQIAQGDLAAAVRWARERGVGATDDVSYLSEFDHLTVVRLLIAQHRSGRHPGALDEAARLLQRLHGPAKASGRAGSLLEIRMLDALVLDAQGRRPQALECLGRAWADVPEPEGYARLFLDEGSPVLELLRAAQTQDPTDDHARRLLGLSRTAEGAADGAEPAGSRHGAHSSTDLLTEPLTDPLTGRELQVLRLLDGELTGPQIARELFVSHNTVRTHTKHIFTKLGVTSRRAAVRQARERGLM